MSRTDIEMFERKGDPDVDGTAISDYVYDKFQGRYGYLKENGCMINIKHEDLNEHISMKILKRLGLNAADTELVKLEDGSEGWISYDLLKDNEEAKNLEFLLSVNENDTHEEIFIKCVSEIENKLIEQGLSSDTVERLLGEFLEAMLVYALLSNYDYKPDNLKIVYDKNKNEYKSLIYYDFGTAFNKNAMQRNGIFFILDDKEVIEFLINNYGRYLDDIIEKIHYVVTPRLLNDLLETEEVDDNYKEQVINTVLGNLVDINKILMEQSVRKAV